MESWRRHRGDQTRDDVRGLEHERARAVPPRPLEAELELAVRAALEAVLRDGRACNVLAEPLHSPAIRPSTTCTAWMLMPRTSAMGWSVASTMGWSVASTARGRAGGSGDAMSRSGGWPARSPLTEMPRAAAA